MEHIIRRTLLSTLYIFDVVVVLLLSADGARDARSTNGDVGEILSSWEHMHSFMYHLAPNAKYRFSFLSLLGKSTCARRGKGLCNVCELCYYYFFFFEIFMFFVFSPFERGVNCKPVACHRLHHRSFAIVYTVREARARTLSCDFCRLTGFRCLREKKKGTLSGEGAATCYTHSMHACF